MDLENQSTWKHAYGVNLQRRYRIKLDELPLEGIFTNRFWSNTYTCVPSMDYKFVAKGNLFFLP